ncbi:hypothetical protein J437_LFUL016870, partial [Ladona fulva]
MATVSVIGVNFLQDLPFIVRAYPIEAEPSVVEEEKRVLEPIDVPLVSEGEGRKLRPRKPTNYRLDCPSPRLERDFSDSGSSNFIPEKENGHRSSSESSYGSRRNSGDKSLTAPEGAVHPEVCSTANPIAKKRIYKRKSRVQGRKSRVRKKGSGGQLGKAEVIQTDTVVGGRLDYGGGAPVGNNPSGLVYEDHVSSATSSTRPYKAGPAVDNGKGNFSDSVVSERGRGPGNQPGLATSVLYRLLRLYGKSAATDSAVETVALASGNELREEERGSLSAVGAESVLKCQMVNSGRCPGNQPGLATSVLYRLLRHYGKSAATDLADKGGTVDDELSLRTFEVNSEGNTDVGVFVEPDATQNVVKGLGKGAAADATTDHRSGGRESRNGEPSEATSRQPSGFFHCNNSDSDWWESDENDNFSETSMFIIDPCEADITPERLAKTEYLCEICGRILISAPSLLTHKKIHNGDRRFSCEKCQKTFLSKNQLQNHMSSHGDYRPFKCDKCPKAFKLKSHLEQHGISHTGKRKYPCPHCEDSFRTRWQFKSHQKKHEGKVFQRKALLVMHFHMHSKPYKCSICDQGFAKDSERVDHESKHAGERKYQCDICGMKFFRRGNCWKHRRDIHIEVQKYRCRFCSFRTKYKFEWKKHEGKHRKRRGESICGSILTSNSSLFTHMKIHSGDRRFSCEKCQKTFMRKECLQKHMSSHGDYRPFKCDKCPKAFKLKYHLEQHGISHTGKRRYPCPHCEDSFRTRWQFKSHQKKHEGKVFWKCDCGE